MTFDARRLPPGTTIVTGYDEQGNSRVTVVPPQDTTIGPTNVNVSQNVVVNAMNNYTPPPVPDPPADNGVTRSRITSLYMTPAELKISEELLVSGIKSFVDTDPLYDSGDSDTQYVDEGWQNFVGSGMSASIGMLAGIGNGSFSTLPYYGDPRGFVHVPDSTGQLLTTNDVQGAAKIVSVDSFSGAGNVWVTNSTTFIFCTSSGGAVSSIAIGNDPVVSYTGTGGAPFTGNEPPELQNGYWTFYSSWFYDAFSTWPNASTAVSVDVTLDNGNTLTLNFTWA